MANPVELRMRAISTKVNPKPVLDDLAARHCLVLLRVAFLADKFKIPKDLVVSRDESGVFPRRNCRHADIGSKDVLGNGKRQMAISLKLSLKVLLNSAIPQMQTFIELKGGKLLSLIIAGLITGMVWILCCVLLVVLIPAGCCRKSKSIAKIKLILGSSPSVLAPQKTPAKIDKLLYFLDVAHKKVKL